MSTYTHQASAPPLARSNSLFGAIKNIVTAPFSTWFGVSEEDEFEGAKGKRRRLATVPEDTQMEDETTPSRTKRMRVSSPTRDSQPYLDPPGSAFAQPRRTSVHSASGAARDVTRSPRKSLHAPSSSDQLPRNRRTVSPLPSGSYLKPDGATRTMSLDPPARSSLSSRVQPAPSIPETRSQPNHARGSTSSTRDISMSPRRIRVRSSLTPQPSGATFGPVVPPRRERRPDEPPPLAALMSNPMFVKPPGSQKQGTADPPKQLTLGTLIDSQRSARAPSRQSSILFGTGSMTDVSARHIWPVNKAEMALHELEVYKTPLLPTRLKGATAVPDMFMHKEKKHITLMTDDRPAKPRLGTKVKGKKRERGKETINGTKPYAGEGGMKKWLARRKREEEEEKEKESAEAMEDERAEEEKKRKDAEVERKKREEELKVPPPPFSLPAFEPRISHEGSLRSSLRVSRTRIGRNHLERPVSRRTKFSAAFEDEDEEMDESRSTEQKVLEEAAKKAPVFELPEGFTFTQTTITHDLTHAKEPPIASLPFSLTKPAPDSPQAAAATATTTKVAPMVPSIQTAPPVISLVPPTPETIKIASEAPSIPPAAAAPSGIPNFFANSPVLAKPASVTTQLPVPAVLAVEQPKPIELPAPSVPKADGAIASLFGAPSRPISVFDAPTSDIATHPPAILAPATIPKEAEKPTTTTPSLALPFSFGAPSKPVEPVSVPTGGPPSEKPPVAEPVKPVTALSNGAPFTFGAPAAAPSPAPATISTPVVPTAVEAPKSAFTFGQPAPAVTTSTPTTAPVTAVPAPNSSKPLFGTPPLVTQFSFGQRPSTVPVDEKPTTGPFTFASTAEKKPATAFNFGSSTTPSAPPAALAPFSFGATPSGSNAADVSSKPFAFGAAVPARPATPPKTVQEVTMDESPARDMVLNGTNKAPERPTLNFSFTPPNGSALFAQSPATTTGSFSFGAPGSTVNPFAKEEKKESKPTAPFGSFGQASAGFSFGQNPPESPATTAPATTPFHFAQPSPSAAPLSPFTFGAAPASASGFGQPSVVSAPSSPSFNRPTPFAFGPPTTTQSVGNPFAFGTGSQPASPATGSTTLPSGTTGSSPFAFGGVTNAAAPAAVGFGAPTPAAAPTGGSLFTIGSAPPPPDGAGGRRIIKSLPRRGRR